jgi:hypothetical protein
MASQHKLGGSKERGLASFRKAKRIKVASKGGKAAHKKDTARRWTSETGRAAVCKYWADYRANPNMVRRVSPRVETERTRNNPNRFGNMPREKQRVINSNGGRKAHKEGRAHEWDEKQASAAGALAHWPKYFVDFAGQLLRQSGNLQPMEIWNGEKFGETVGRVLSVRIPLAKAVKILQDASQDQGVLLTDKAARQKLREDSTEEP